MLDAVAAGLLLAREAVSGGGPAFPAAAGSPDDLYLAPHFDDICFSLGALAAARRAGTVVTFCTRSRYVAREDGVPADEGARIRHVSALRRAEDARFAAACGLRQECLDLPEAVLRGRRPFQTEAAAQDWPIFAEALQRLPAAAAARPWLFCPSGIGGHVDHVALRRAVVADLQHLSARYRVAFYEDLHYASHRWPRLRALAGLRRQVPGLRRFHVPGNAQKLALIRLYESQFDVLPLSLARFTPAAWQAGLHEAIWTSEPL